MAVFMGAFPVLPGKEDEARKLATELRQRGDEFGASETRLGVTREEWSLQQTPLGSQVIVRFECADVGAAFGGLAQSSEPFDLWFRERVKDISGVDLGQPSQGPAPEIIFDWSAQPAAAAR
jgi:hypothetical protein